ncbi:hypothetical protein B296_00017832 [Ensete ventricosum]|uniref:Uncharacterized protein n=1 Tax=Ensete ventricosum TaxID=4639 RepID=A0A426ZRA7_ENSVE|nr:hypothetical protein B296_00017832 [Ensete ventricosum]
MLRQVSSRNHRRKGEFRAKNALQICIFVAVCVWLLYQMNHSHARRKAYAESFDRGQQSDITRYGRKDLLPSTGSADSVVDAKVKEDADVKEQEIEHEEGAENHRSDGRDKARAEHTPRQAGAFEDQEHDERYREAREKSFKGDDASSEVVHYSSQDIEHEERAQQARERSFRADDASSAVDHVVQVKEFDSETELLDSFKGTNSSVILHEDNSTLPNSEDTTAADVLEKTEPGVAHTKIDERSSSSTTTGEVDENMEEQTDLGIGDHVDNETKPQTYAANESVSQIELGVRSVDLPKNHTAVSEDWTEAQENQTTANVTVLRNQTSLNPLINSTATLQTPWKEVKTENTMMIQKSDKTTRPEESGEGSKTTAIKDDHNKVLLQQSKDYLRSMSRGERKDERDGLSGLKEIQNKVEESGKEEAVE